MLSKVKDMMNTAELLKELNNTIKTELTELKDSIKETKDEVKDLKDQIDTVKTTNINLVTTFNQNIETINQLKKKFEGQIQDFTDQKVRLQDIFIKSTTESVKKELDNLKTDITRYNDLKSEINNTSLSLNNLKSNIERLNTVTTKIKNTDFDFNKTTTRIVQLEKTKENLTLEIDKLQRIISKKRRNDSMR